MDLCYCCYFECDILSYLASSVTMVTGSSVGRGFEGRAAGSREEGGGTWELYHLNILAKSTFFLKTPDCSFNESLSWYKFNRETVMKLNKTWPTVKQDSQRDAAGQQMGDFHMC